MTSLSENDISRAAGSSAFWKGQSYLRGGRVVLFDAAAGGVQARTRRGGGRSPCPYSVVQWFRKNSATLSRAKPALGNSAADR